jgi:hypothetical protein
VEPACQGDCVICTDRCRADCTARGLSKMKIVQVCTSWGISIFYCDSFVVDRYFGLTVFATAPGGEPLQASIKASEIIGTIVVGRVRN